MERRKLRALRALINVSLLSLIFGATINLLASLLGSYSAIGLGLAGVLLTFYCYRRADRVEASHTAYNLWRLLPTLTFVLVPLFIFWYGSDSQWTTAEVLLLTEVGASYLLPISCLLIVERTMKKAQQ